MTATANSGSTSSESADELTRFSSGAEPHPLRRSARVSWQVPVLLTSLNPNIAFRERCKTVVVNLHGCGLRTSTTLPRGTPVQLHVSGNVITGRVVDAVPIAIHKKLWLLGIALDQPGNFWGIKDPPKEWDAFAEPAPHEPSPSASDPQSGRDASAEKFTVWPSAFGPAVQHPAALSPGEPQSSPPQETAAEHTVGNISSEQLQQQSRQAIAAGLVRLQAEIERRAAAEWLRLRSQAEQHVQQAGTQLRSELEQGLTAWRAERAAVEGNIEDLARLRQQVEVRLNAVGDVLRRELAPVQDEMIDRIRKELRAVISSSQEKAAADWTGREQRMSAGLTRLEDIREQVDHACQARESVESLVRSVPEVIETQVKDRAQAMLQEVHDGIAQEVSARVTSAFDGVEKRLGDMLGDANHPVCQKLSDEFHRKQEKLLDATAAGIAAEWTRLRNQADQRAQESATQLRSELDQGLTALREERAGMEGKIQDLSGLREQIETRLNAVGDVLREEFAPVRDQIIDQARQELRAVISDFQVKTAPDWTAREQRMSAGLAKLEDTQNACMRLASQVQQRVDEDRAARDAISAQVAQILQARAQEESLLGQLRTEQQAIQEQIREQVDLARNAAQEHVESLVRSVPEVIETQVKDRAQAMLQEVCDGIAQEVSARVTSACDGVEKRLEDMAGSAIRDLPLKLSEEYAHYQVQFLDATAARVTELRELELSVRKFASESAASFAIESEQALAQLREQLQNVLAEQQQRVEQASKDALAGLQAVAGNLLTSMRHGLLNDLGHEQEQVRQRVQTNIEEALRQAQQTADAALHEQARQVLDGLRRELLNSFEERQQRFETAHLAATAQLQQLEKRTDELTAIVDVELQSHTEEAVKEAVAQITEQVQKASSSIREAHVATTQEELDRSLGLVVKQAGAAGAELRVTLDSLQEHRKAAESACAQLHHEVQEAQTWVARETEQFQRTVQDAFLKAAGEIRGRIHQAIEMASEPIESRTREIETEIVTLTKKQSEELSRQLESALQRLQSACEESQSAAERAFHKRATDTLDGLRQNAEQLAQNSIDTWQSALTETLAAVPRILAAKLPDGKSTSASPYGERCVAEDHPGDGDGGTQGA